MVWQLWAVWVVVCVFVLRFDFVVALCYSVGLVLFWYLLLCGGGFGFWLIWVLLVLAACAELMWFLVWLLCFGGFAGLRVVLQSLFVVLLAYYVDLVVGYAG